MKNLKTIVQYLLITAIGAYFLYFVFKGTNWSEQFEKIKQSDFSWLALGMGIALLSHYLRGLRAVMFYEALGYKVSVKNSVLAVLVGYMMNYVIPRAGEVSRCAALNKTDDLPVDKSLGTVVTERAFDLLILLILLVAVFFLQAEMMQTYFNASFGSSTASAPYWQNPKMISAVLALSMLIFIFAFRKKLVQLSLVQKIILVLKGFSEGLLSIRKVKSPLLFVLYSFAIWICYVLMMYFCLFAMQPTAHINFAGCLTVFAIGTIGMVIPAPGAGAGPYHAAIIFSLGLFGVEAEDAKAYAILVHGAQMVILLTLGGVASLMVLSSHRKKQYGISQP